LQRVELSLSHRVSVAKLPQLNLIHRRGRIDASVTIDPVMHMASARHGSPPRSWATIMEPARLSGKSATAAPSAPFWERQSCAASDEPPWRASPSS
jgi:hypothetical protein